MAMSFNKLHLFIRVAECENITHVAEELFISQSSVSKSIKELESELGVELFNRSKKNGLSLTEVGKQMLTYAKQITAAESSMYETASLAKMKRKRTLKFASLPIYFDSILVKAIVKFYEKAPNINVEVLYGEREELCKMVADGKAEFALMFLPSPLKLEYKILASDELVIVSNQKRSYDYIDLHTTTERFYAAPSVYKAIISELNPSFTLIKDSGIISQRPKAVLDTHTFSIHSEAFIDENMPCLKKYSVIPKIPFDRIVVAESFENLSPNGALFLETLRETAEI